MPYVSKNASKEQDRITPEVLESLATFREEHGESVASVYRRAARTIRALQEAEAARAFADIGLDKWRERALAADRVLADLLVETADLREIKRCRKSIEAAGCQWTCNSKRPPRCSIAWCGDYTAWMNAGPEGVGETVEGWQSAERAAWEHAAAPFRARIEAAGFELKLRFAEGGNNPIEIVRCASIDDNLWEVSYHAGDLGGSPTFDALEKAASWAEAHPANAPQKTDDLPDLWTTKPEFAPVDTPAARALLALMQRLNDDCWSAGWMANAEYDLWERVYSADRLWGNGYITIQEAKDLRHWSNECGGWIVHRDDAFWVVPIEHWRGMYAAHTPA